LPKGLNLVKRLVNYIGAKLAHSTGLLGNTDELVMKIIGTEGLLKAMAA